jgi:hypothetical protein
LMPSMRNTNHSAGSFSKTVPRVAHHKLHIISRNGLIRGDRWRDHGLTGELSWCFADRTIMNSPQETCQTNETADASRTEEYIAECMMFDSSRHSR